MISLKQYLLLSQKRKQDSHKVPRTLKVHGTLKSTMKMKKGILFAILLISFIPAPSQDLTPLTVGFWNVENLFDLVDDPYKNDDEFTPTGKKHVTQEVLDLKLDHISDVLSDLNVDILGLAEVENRLVLEMVNQRYAEKDYDIVHYESPDHRGIDVALLYDPARFQVISSKPIPILLGEGKTTRDILYVKGEFAGVELHLFVNHWPSHWGGTEATIPLREKAAKTLRKEINRILEEDPDAEIVIIGDLNDNPTDASVQIHLGSTMAKDSVYVGGRILWNLMAPFVGKPNRGTYKYQGKDKIIDQIIVSPGLSDTKGLTILAKTIEILDTPKYRQQKGKYVGYPFRFWVGDTLLGGYSDHLAVKVSIAINQ